MYIHNDSDSGYISLHDCKANAITYEDSVLSFHFPDGIWITPDHPAGGADKMAQTEAARVDFPIWEEAFGGIQVFLFRAKGNQKAIREEWAIADFIKAVNAGAFTVEFVDVYKTYRSILLKCVVHGEKKPYISECEICLKSEKEIYQWNHLVSGETR